MRVCATAQFWWRAAIVACGVVGLLLGEHRIIYYTSQSNIITLGYFGGALYWMVRRGTTDPAAPRLRGAVTLWIVITGLISHVLLNHGENPLPGLADDDPFTALTNRSLFLVHYVVPVMVLADWIAFGPRRASSWRDLPLWILFPLGYGVAVELRAVLFPVVTNRYPYFFLDPTENGYGFVVRQFVQLGVIFAVLGAILLALDRLMAGRRHPQPGSDGARKAPAAIGTAAPGGATAEAAARDASAPGSAASAGPAGPAGAEPGAGVSGRSGRI